MKNTNRPRRALAASRSIAAALGAVALCAAALAGCSSDPPQDLPPTVPATPGPISPSSPAAPGSQTATPPGPSVPSLSSDGTATAPPGPSAPSPLEAAAPNLPSDPMTSADPGSEASQPAPSESDAPQMEVATLGAGCFWCIEAVLEQVDGVESVVSGYMGGQTLNPTYKDICTGTTGHAEVVQVTFNPKVLPYKDLLDWFWRSHDPTTLNRQGADRGTQYRSAIFTHSEAQLAIATTSKTDVAPTFKDPIVTQVVPISTFYPAEGYHQGYYFDNASQGYCRNIIAPKLKKLGLKY